jgi:hypothetical protein
LGIRASVALLDKSDGQVCASAPAGCCACEILGQQIVVENVAGEGVLQA